LNKPLANLVCAKDLEKMDSNSHSQAENIKTGLKELLILAGKALLKPETSYFNNDNTPTEFMNGASAHFTSSTAVEPAENVKEVPNNFEILKFNLDRLQRLRFPIVQELASMGGGIGGYFSFENALNPFAPVPYVNAGGLSFEC
jgi:hypothetical protein